MLICAESFYLLISRIVYIYMWPDNVCSEVPRKEQEQANLVFHFKKLKNAELSLIRLIRVIQLVFIYAPLTVTRKLCCLIVIWESLTILYCVTRKRRKWKLHQDFKLPGIPVQIFHEKKTTLELGCGWLVYFGQFCN